MHRGVIRRNRHYFGISSKWEQMYLQGTGQTAPSLKEPSAENQTKPADDSFRDGAVCPVPWLYICSHFEEIPR